MSGWIYILELSPTDCVKVGRTEDLCERMAKHLNEAMTYGVRVTRLSTFAVDNPLRAEAELLAALRKYPTASNEFGRETFTGITFKDAADAVGALRGDRAPIGEIGEGASWTARTDLLTGLRSVATPQTVEPDPGNLTAIWETVQQPRERANVILSRLHQYDWGRYKSWNQRRLIEELEGVWGIPVRTVKGYRVVLAADVQRAHDAGCGEPVDERHSAG